MTEYSPGMRVIIRDEEWMVKKVEHNSLGNKSLYCVGISRFRTLDMTHVKKIIIGDYSLETTL